MRAKPTCRPRWALAASALMVVAGVALAATAFACTPNAVITIDGPVAPGGTVTGEGTGFGPGNAPGVASVEVQLETSRGESLGRVWAGSSSEDGRLSFSFKAPETAGYYTVVAIRSGARGGASNNLQVGDPQAESEPAPSPAPAQPSPPAAAAPSPSGPVAGPSPNGSNSPVRAKSPARQPARPGAPKAADSPRGTVVAKAAPAVSGAPTGAARLQPLSQLRPAEAGGVSRSDRPPAGSRTTSVPALAGTRRSAAAAGGASGSGDGSGSVWLGLALVGGGLLAALTAGAGMVGRTESPRWSLARRRRRR